MKKAIQLIIAISAVTLVLPQAIAKERKAIGEFIPISWEQPTGVDPSLYIVEVKMDNGIKCYFISNQSKQFLLDSIDQIRGIGCK